MHSVVSSVTQEDLRTDELYFGNCYDNGDEFALWTHRSWNGAAPNNDSHFCKCFVKAELLAFEIQTGTFLSKAVLPFPFHPRHLAMVHGKSRDQSRLRTTTTTSTTTATSPNAWTTTTQPPLQFCQEVSKAGHGKATVNAHNSVASLQDVICVALVILVYPTLQRWIPWPRGEVFRCLNFTNPRSLWGTKYLCLMLTWQEEAQQVILGSGKFLVLLNLATVPERRFSPTNRFQLSCPASYSEL